jgi:hypothetical protein
MIGTRIVSAQVPKLCINHILNIYRNLTGMYSDIQFDVSSTL